MKKLFYIGVLFILLAHFYLHYSAISGNNFYFTIDQGNDAIFIRDIIEHHALVLKGPETSVRGIFAGPLWYYFLVPGMILSHGNPVGAVYTLIVLNAVLLLFIILWVRKKVGPLPALGIGLALLFSWTFFETSLWAFNPFPTLMTCLLRIIFLIEFLEGKKRYYYWAVLVTLLTFNFDVAIAVALTIFTFSVGAWGVRKKILSMKEYVISSFTLPAIAIVFLAKQFFVVFLETRVISTKHAGLGVFSGTNIGKMIIEFLKMIGTVIPQHTVAGVLLFILVTYFFFKQKKKNKYIRDFAILTFDLTIISFLFFASNRGWRTWHTVYLPPILFISFLLMVFGLPKKVAIPAFLIVFTFKIIFFHNFFLKYGEPSPNASLLYNELSTVDWVYTHAESQGFKVYTYTDTFYDDPYQYLFWWHGLNEYHYLPDEYSNFPLSHKELYVPGYNFYMEPKRGSDRIAFLIIQSDTNGETNSNWIDKFKQYHTMQEETHVGDIVIQKYYRKIDAPSDYCIWWEKCN